MSSGLSDVLRQMADGRTPHPHDDDAFDTEVEAQATPMPIAEPAAARSQRPSRPASPAAPVPSAAASARLGPAARTNARRRKSNQQLKEVATPIVFTVGLLLLFPAIWGTLVLMGQNIWRSDKPDAPTVAKDMLICWPLSLALIGLAVVMFLQVRAERDE